MASPHPQLKGRAVVAGAAALVPAPEDMDPVPSTLTKTYFPRGPLQQFRFVDGTSFRCFRCSETKKSKLINVYSGDWSKRLCNGCHERLLSLYEIKAGTAAEDQKAEDLVAALLSAVAADDQCQAELGLKASEKRAEQLSPESVRFIATAEHVAAELQEDPHLEWSPAVIGLCKAVEWEVIVRILRPLAASASRKDLTADKSDKDLGRVAKFCAGQAQKPPELGAFGRFLQTATHSQERRETSALLGCFLKLVAEWTGSHWLLDPKGLHFKLDNLITHFRNRAAHIDELGMNDYVSCRDLVIGSEGLLWKLVVATERHK